MLALAAAAAADEPEFLSEICRREVAQAALVCVGEVRAVRKLGPTHVVDFGVLEVLRGAEPAGTTVHVLTMDPAPWPVGTRLLGFLGPLSGPERFRDLGRIVLGNPEGDERLRFLRALLAAEAVADPAGRRTALRAVLRDGLGGREWTRQAAVGEWWVLAEREPGLLQDEDRLALEALLGLALKRTLRWYVVSTLCRARVAEPLARCLGGADAPTRAAGAAAVRDIVDVRRDDYLVQRLAGDADPIRRARLAELCGALGGPLFAKALRARLADDPDPRVRRAAATGLSWCDRDAGEPLLRALASDDSAEVRATAAFCLARRRDPRAAAEIARQLAGSAPPGLAIALQLAQERLSGRPATPGVAPAPPGSAPGAR